MLQKLMMFLSSSVLITSLPVDCQSPETQQKGRQCISTLQPMLDEIRNAQKNNWISEDAAKRMDSLCSVSLDCFITLQHCANIDSTLILSIEGVCEQYKFINGDYKDCFAKLEEKRNNKCFSNFFMNPMYTDTKDRNKRCDSMKSDGKCVKKNTENFCTKKLAKDFDDYLSSQEKRFDC